MTQLPTSWVAPASDGHLEFLVVPPTTNGWSSLGGIARLSQSGPPSFTWNPGWQQMPPPQNAAEQPVTPTWIIQPTVVADHDQSLHAFVTDGQSYWHLWQTSDTTWADTWWPLGSPGTNVAKASVGVNQDGRLELFTTANDGQLWHVWQTSTGGNQSWSGWQLMDPPCHWFKYGPTVTNYSDGSLAVFGVDKYGVLWTASQYPPSNGWQPWTRSLTPPVSLCSSPVAVPNQDTSMNLFVLGADAQLHHVHSGFWWESWESLGAPPAVTSGTFTGPVVTSDAQGRLLVIVGDTQANQLYYKWQQAVNVNAWPQDWTPLLQGSSTGIYPSLDRFAAAVNTANQTTEILVWDPPSAIPLFPSGFQVYYTSNALNSGDDDSWSPTWAPIIF
jgi:hypothetical protein